MNLCACETEIVLACLCVWVLLLQELAITHNGIVSHHLI